MSDKREEHKPRDTTDLQLAALVEFDENFNRLYLDAISLGFHELGALLRVCIAWTNREIEQLGSSEKPGKHITEITDPDEIAQVYRNLYCEQAPTNIFARALQSKDVAELRMWVGALELLEDEVRLHLH